MRRGGVAVPAFFTPTGAGTLVGDGGIPWRYDVEGNVTRDSFNFCGSGI